MKIMICGGLDDANAESETGRRIAEFSHMLAVQVIKQGHTLLCGNLSSLDTLIINAACAAAEAEHLNPEELVVSYVPRDAEARNPHGQVNGSANPDWNSMSGRKPNVPEPIAQADVLVLVGGYGQASGTYTAANWARQSGTPILPISTFGMAARNIFDDLRDASDRHKTTGLSDADLQALTKASAVLTDTAKIEAYATQVISLAEKAALSRDVFVIMSFAEDEDMVDYLAAVTEVCHSAGFEAVRTDTRPTDNAHQIIDSIHDAIANCGFVIADLTKERPNVYYEIGFVRGLEKRLILTSKKGTEVHFDLQGFNRIEWKGSENLKAQLRPVVKEFSASFGLQPK